MTTFRPLSDSSDIDISLELGEKQFTELKELLGGAPLSDDFRSRVSTACQFYSGQTLGRHRWPKAGVAKQYIDDAEKVVDEAGRIIAGLISVPPPSGIDASRPGYDSRYLNRSLRWHLEDLIGGDRQFWEGHGLTAWRALVRIATGLREIAASDDLAEIGRGAEYTGRDVFVDRLLVAYEEQTGKRASAGSEKTRSEFVEYLEMVNAFLPSVEQRIPGVMRDLAKAAIKRNTETLQTGK